MIGVNDFAGEAEAGSFGMATAAEFLGEFGDVDIGFCRPHAAFNDVVEVLAEDEDDIGFVKGS